MKNKLTIQNKKIKDHMYFKVRVFYFLTIIYPLYNGKITTP